VFARPHVVSFLGLVASLLLTATSLAVAQEPKPKPPLTPLPGGVTPACVTGCVPPYAVRVTPGGANAGTKPANTGGYSAVFTVPRVDLRAGHRVLRRGQCRFGERQAWRHRDLRGLRRHRVLECHGRRTAWRTRRGAARPNPRALLRMTPRTLFGVAAIAC